MKPRHRPLGGVGWTIAGYAATRAIIYGATLVLAHLLEPGDFGMVAIAMLLVTTVNTVTDLGLGDAVIVVRDDRALLRTIFGLLIAAGAVGALLVVLTADPLAALFDSPRLQSVLVVLSVSLLLSGATTFYQGLLERELHFRSRFAAQLAQAIAYAGVAIGAAVGGAGVWSLVAGQLAGAFAYVTALIVRAPYRVGPALGVERSRQALRAGSAFLAQSVFERVHHNVDIAATGYVLGARATGFYSMSYAVAALPYNAFTHPVATVAFPAFARRHRRGEATAELGLELLAIITLFACPAGVLMSATADPLITTLLGSKWQPAIGPLAVLGGFAAVVQIQAALGWYLNSTGRPAVNAIVSAAVVVPLLPALLIAANVGGATGVAWAMLGSAVVTSITLMVYVQRRAELPLRRQLATLQSIALGSAIAWLAARLTVNLLADSPGGLGLVAAIVVGLTTYVATIRLIDPHRLRRGVTFVIDAISDLRGPAVLPTTVPPPNAVRAIGD